MDPNLSSDVPNARPGVRIPAGRRRAILVAAVAVLAGLIAVIAVLVTHGGGGGSATAHHKPLAGRPPLFLELPGAPVKGGVDAVYAAAKARLPANDPRVAVARAIAGYGPATRTQTIAALERLPQSNPAVVFELGLAQLWAGDTQAAKNSLDRVKQLDPYGYYGTSADNLLYLNEVPGYPLYFPPLSPKRSVASLEAEATRNPGNATVWLDLAVKLERSDRLQAIKDARRAAALAPTGVPEQVAVAVLGFDKAKPMNAISALGDLATAKATQHDPAVHFHLGELYFWLRDSQDATAQFTQVAQDAPPSNPYRQVAHVFSACINNAAVCARLGAKG
jgi:tetratricopeptide (TPR) repeat protein